MLTLRKLTTFLLFPFLFYSNAHGQTTYPQGNKGFLSFNFGTTTFPPNKYQKVSIFGCNTILTDSVLTQNPHNSKGRNPNQVLSGVPCGWQIDQGTKESYYVSKYYIASPPIVKKLMGDTLYDLGIVTPDEFDLIGDKPVQLVYMDYNVLKPLYIEYLPIEFDASFKNFDTATVPFQVECKGFPWLDTNGLQGAKGASGIGYLKNNVMHTGRLFLPYYYKEGKSTNDSVKVYLDCQVTILNDILFHQEVFFKIDDTLFSSINLKDYKDRRQKLKFSRKYKKELPCGCKEPERARKGPQP
jgi:hypothetical protein